MSSKPISIPADIRARTYNLGGERKRFEPYGPIGITGDIGFDLEAVPRTKANPMPRLKELARTDRPKQGARLIIGFNVNGVPPSNVEATRKKVMDTVYRVRAEEVELAFKEGYATPNEFGGDIGASFIDQSGLWQPVSEKAASPERGMQIVFFNTIDEDEAEFKNDMEYLAGELATIFDQDVIIVEHQKNGTTVQEVQMGWR